MPPSGEPNKSPKPQPIGNEAFILLFTLCTLCALFILWRRANRIRTVVAHQLKTWTSTEGRIRLSEDDGPPARSFVEDDADDDDAEDAEPLAMHVERLRNARKSRNANNTGNSPPTPPPKAQIPEEPLLA